jgi:demethoxyubiquinone hydroxylase (CLK1/Coq7/Cat5 family)
MRGALSKIAKKNYSKNWKPNMPEHKVILNLDSYKFPHPIWDLKSAENVEITHKKPETRKDQLAFFIMKCLRVSYDSLSGYKPGKMNESLYLRRCIFLETIAGVPGFIGGMMRHLHSLRSLRKDGGWIHHLLEEAENERQHLITFLSIRQPGIFTRLFIIFSQFSFIAGYTLMYLLSPTTAHRFVAYLEEEAVKTYTQLLKDLDDGKLPHWEDMKASPEAIKYWGLPYNAKFRDVIISIRADECSHREFNHHFADIPKDSFIENHKLEVSRYDEANKKNEMI